MDWFLYDIGLRHERVKEYCIIFLTALKVNSFRLFREIEY